jgi:uncharacterized protein YjiS (DUF1127 family)
VNQVSSSSPHSHHHVDFAPDKAQNGLLGRATDLYWVWRERRRSRADLVGMPEAALKDIGLSRGDAEQEWQKPFWRG